VITVSRSTDWSGGPDFCLGAKGIFVHSIERVDEGGRETARPLGLRFGQLRGDSEVDMGGNQPGQRIRRNRGIGRNQGAKRTARRGDAWQERASAANLDQDDLPVDPSPADD